MRQKTQHTAKAVLSDCLWWKQLPSQVPGVHIWKFVPTPTFKCKEDGRADISLICGFHRANAALGMVIPEVQGEVACEKGEVC